MFMRARLQQSWCFVFGLCWSLRSRPHSRGSDEVTLQWQSKHGVIRVTGSSWGLQRKFFICSYEITRLVYFRGEEVNTAPLVSNHHHHHHPKLNIAIRSTRLRVFRRWAFTPSVEFPLLRPWSDAAAAETDLRLFSTSKAPVSTEYQQQQQQTTVCRPLYNSDCQCCVESESRRQPDRRGSAGQRGWAGRVEPVVSRSIKTAVWRVNMDLRSGGTRRWIMNSSSSTRQSGTTPSPSAGLDQEPDLDPDPAPFIDSASAPKATNVKITARLMTVDEIKMLLGVREEGGQMTTAEGGQGWKTREKQRVREWIWSHGH